MYSYLELHVREIVSPRSTRSDATVKLVVAKGCFHSVELVDTGLA